MIDDAMIDDPSNHESLAEHTAAVLALTTAADRDEAERLAHLLVEQRLAACVNLVPGLQSIYRWQGVVESGAEILLLIKTSSHLLSDLEQAIRANHSYELPEFVVVPIQSGSKAYLQWLAESLRAGNSEQGS